jgi:hypothetical protein
MSQDEMFGPQIGSGYLSSDTMDTRSPPTLVTPCVPRHGMLAHPVRSRQHDERDCCRFGLITYERAHPSIQLRITTEPAGSSYSQTWLSSPT